MFRIWASNDAIWEVFQQDTNKFGILTWEFETPSLSVDFLDLTISIEGNKITTKTYHKFLNLYQYLMPQPNHPPRMMKGIIFSLMQNYKHQNTYHYDYKAMSMNLFHRHVARGWDRRTMKTWILEADTKIHTESTTGPPTTHPTKDMTINNNNSVFLHFKYHCNNILKKAV